MLESLHIENIAIIKAIDVDIPPGFTVLTGETGAGKSIIIDSIGLLLGDKADKELVRSGEKSALVLGTFRGFSDNARLRMAELGLLPDASEDDADPDSVMIQRTISVDGRSSIRFSGRPITLSMLREIAPLLMTIHGQNDNGELLKKSAHLSLLDRYADSEALLSEYRTVFAAYRSKSQEAAEYKRTSAEKERLAEMLAYQIRDIDAGKLKDGEEEALMQERNQLQYAEKIAKSTEFCYRALKGSEKGSVILLLEKSASALRALQNFLPDAEALADRLDECRYEIDDIAESTVSLSELDCDDPTARLNLVEERLDLIRKLERKYGETIKEVLLFRKKAMEEYNRIDRGAEFLAELEAQIESLLAEASEQATALSALRKEKAVEIEREIADTLSFLDMPKVRFSVQIERAAELSHTGKDDVEFLMSANPNEPLAPLIKIASGGELARIMLALQSVFLDKEGINAMIFDEIDTGVSGKTSQKIGIKLRMLSKGAQVICITHSPQIAALADHHFRIAKREIDGRNETSLKLLTESERIEEIARILGGINVTETQRQNAKELIEDGKGF
ncbi:MAG: DNA repair protein RecN [Clostridia bacterium]|nr:DNA repair protein RecN [Clostridia bacterium]